MKAAGAPASVMPVLSAFVAGAAARPLPSAVLEKTKQHVLNTLACMISGTTLEPGHLAIGMVRDYGGAPHACIPGTDLVALGEIAAFVNGMTARAGESDDLHARSRIHPGSSIVPAALAMAERTGASGERFLRAVCAGYDVGCRIVHGLGLARLEDRGFGPHAFGQVWGAAVAAGVVNGVSEREARYLLSYAAQQTCGLASWRNDDRHSEISFFMGARPARDGYWAAAMVAAKFSANPDVLVGRDNFQDTFSDAADPREFVDALDERYEVMETSLKRWHVGGPIHASLESLIALRERYCLTPDNVARITARVPTRDGVIVRDRNAPNVNFHHVLAVALMDGGMSLAATYDEARMRDPQVQAVAARVEMILDDELQKLMPNRTAVVEVLTTDGRRLSHRTDALLGSPAAPMTQAQVEEVARELIAPVFGAPRTERLVTAVRELEWVTDVRSLRPLLRLTAG
jgi:2-methylcitrate dehydratase PrpD